MDGHYFESRCYVNFCKPSTPTCDFDYVDSLIYVVVFKRKFIERDLYWANRSIIRLFLPENFLVATPMGLIRNRSNGGLSNGPIMKPDSTSFLISLFTTPGSMRVD